MSKNWSAATWITLAVITFLAFASVVTVVAIAFTHDRQAAESAQVAQIRKQLAKIEDAIQAYRRHHDDWPTALDTLLCGDQKNFGQPYLDPRDILDPWGFLYVYDAEANPPQVYCKTPQAKIIRTR